MQLTAQLGKFIISLDFEKKQKKEKNTDLFNSRHLTWLEFELNVRLNQTKPDQPDSHSEPANFVFANQNLTHRHFAL